MKNAAIVPALLFCFVFISCKNNCDQNVSINAIQPNSNPAGFEVLIKTSSFSSDAKVIFGKLAASSRAGGELGDIIATVPTGLSGNVEVSVEEGDCIARSGNFVVSGALPDNVQASLPNIIIPVPGTFNESGVSNNWVNAADPSGFTFGVHLSGQFVNGFTSLEQSYEFNYSDPAFNDNPATGTANRNTNVIYLEINRTAKGGIIEHFDGLFVEQPSFLPATVTAAILLTSRETGRQMLLYPA